jgi:hypothetical protein
MDGVIQAALLPPEPKQAVPVPVEVGENGQEDTVGQGEDDTLTDPSGHETESETPSLQTADAVQPASDDVDTGDIRPRRSTTGTGGKRRVKKPSAESMAAADPDVQFEAGNSYLLIQEF